MEAAALFAVGQHRNVSVCSIFVISDLVSEEEWRLGFQTEKLASDLMQLFGLAFRTIAAEARSEPPAEAGKL
jgi:uridine phosphorylase